MQMVDDEESEARSGADKARCLKTNRRGGRMERSSTANQQEQREMLERLNSKAWEIK